MTKSRSTHVFLDKGAPSPEGQPSDDRDLWAFSRAEGAALYPQSLGVGGQPKRGKRRGPGTRYNYPIKVAFTGADDLDEIAEWYRGQLGLSPDRVLRRAVWRMRRIVEYLEEEGLALSEVELQVHLDPLWNTRRGRLPHERRARVVGVSRSVRVWVVPKG